MKYLSNEILKGFDRYKYSSKDTSPISNYIMHPFWDYLVKFVPTWLAPNLLTFMGFLCTVFNFLLLAYLDKNYDASSKGSDHKISQGIWLLVGTLNFLSHQLDGIDGKQARRTNTSSPLGELFDHGCDSWTVSMLPLTILSIFGIGQFGVTHWQIFIVVWIMVICFIMSHWEKYITGILYLPWGYDIGQIGATVACWITFLCSTDGWKFYINFPMKFTMAIVGFSCVVISVVMFSLPMTAYNVIQSYRLKTGRMLSIGEALRPLVSTIIVFTGSLLWALYSPNQIFYSHTRLFMFLVGTVASNVTVRLIIFQMSQTRSELFNVFACLYSAVAVAMTLLPNITLQSELFVLWAMAVFFMIGHVLSAVFIVNELCDHLHIRAFVIRPKVTIQSPVNSKSLSD